MTTDRTFFTNEEGQTLVDRFKDLIGDDTKAFDVLVGYFNISGFHLIADALENVESIRILVGMGIDRKTFSTLNQYRFKFERDKLVKEKTEERLIDELNKSEDSFEVEEGIKKFLNWIEKGKIQIKAYPEPLHAKVYILSFDSKRDAGRVITGSSNFTKSGLMGNLEFNVELKNYSDYEFALNKFNQLWKKSVDITEKVLDTTKNKTWITDNITPYMLYLKFLYEYFYEELYDDKKRNIFSLPNNFIELQYQKDAVIEAEKKLKRYNGVILADVVGLGKTFVSALLMKKIGGKNLVIAPPKLVDNWKSVLFDFGIPAEVVSSGVLNYGNLDYQRILDMDFDHVFVDEAHQFRNEDTQRYDALKDLCIGRKVILITATPYNNKPLDIFNLLKLFQNPRKSDFINPKIKNLEEYFKRLDKKIANARGKPNYKSIVKGVADDIRENVLKHIVIRRTRREIVEFYKEDLEKNKLTFPTVENPVPIFYKLDKNLEELFDYTVEIITKKLKYARYTPLLYERGNIDIFTQQYQKNLAGFMKAMLIKRLESSFEAFKTTLDNIINGYEIFLDLYENQKYVYFSKKYFNKIKEYIEKGDFDGIERLITEGKAEKLPVSKFKKKLKTDLEEDLKLLKDLQNKWNKIDYDPKIEKLKTVLKDLKEKVILFTEAEITANYLFENLKESFKVFKFTGSSSKKDIEIVRLNFDANVKEEEQLDEYDILITTDVLSEGVNLHRSNTVINYDIPWNPVKLIQRVGRVNRVGTKFEKIYIYNFFPSHKAENEIELKKIAEMKIHAIIQMLGSDAKFLTEDEEINSHKLFESLNSKELIEGEEEAGTELMYLQFLRNIRDNQKELFEKIKKIPKKARVGRVKDDKRDGFITFIKKGDLKKIVYIDKDDILQEIPFEVAVELFKADKEERAVNIPKEFYNYLKEAKKYFNEVKSNKSNPKGIEKDVLQIVAILKNSRPNIWSEEEKEFFDNLKEILENGLLSKYKLRVIKGEIQKDVKKQNFREAFQKLQNLIPETYIKDLKDKKEKISYPTEVILSEIFINL